MTRVWASGRVSASTAASLAHGSAVSVRPTPHGGVSGPRLGEVDETAEHKLLTDVGEKVAAQLLVWQVVDEDPELLQGRSKRLGQSTPRRRRGIRWELAGCVWLPNAEQSIDIV